MICGATPGEDDRVVQEAENTVYVFGGYGGGYTAIYGYRPYGYHDAPEATAASYCNRPNCVEDCTDLESKDTDKPHGMCIMVYGEGALGHGWYSW